MTNNSIKHNKQQHEGTYGNKRIREYEYKYEYEHTKEIITRYDITRITTGRYNRDGWIIGTMYINNQNIDYIILLLL